MTDAEIMSSLFEGSDLAHGRTEITGEVKTTGKAEAKSWLEKRKAETTDFDLHLAGRKGIGLSPINSKNQVRWGAIDVDVYNGLDIEALNQRIQLEKIPLVLCRSKSGGPHLFLFLKEYIPAALMIEKLDAIAGHMGFGKSEIFPKQASIPEGGQDFGSWINLPYFGGTRFLRYALDENNKALTTVSSFAQFVGARALDRAELTKYSPIGDGGPLPDGPPCLNRILAGGTSDMRNVVLSNVAVYWKAADPENWEKRLDESNNTFSSPLGSKEVESIKKSYGKKDYKYQCSQQPLCSFCNSTECKKRKFGIGKQEMLPAKRSLTKINTVPPLWYLDLNPRTGAPVRTSFTTEQLQNPRLFQLRCMEAIQLMPPLVKGEEWQPIIDGLMEHCSVTQPAEEMTPIGQFRELITDFLVTRAKEESYEDMLRGLPHHNELGYHFRLKDLWKHVSNMRFQMLKQHEMSAYIHNEMKAEKQMKAIKGKSVRFLTVKLTESDDPESLTPATPNKPF